MMKKGGFDYFKKSKKTAAKSSFGEQERPEFLSGNFNED